MNWDDWKEMKKDAPNGWIYVTRRCKSHEVDEINLVTIGDWENHIMLKKERKKLIKNIEKMKKHIKDSQLKLWKLDSEIHWL